MKESRRDSKEERRVLIGMIVDKIVLGRIYSKKEERMFSSTFSNLVSGWCLNYYDKYDKAPMHHIESIFEAWASKATDKSTISLVEKFLHSLGKEYKSLKRESNSEYILDLAGKYFNRIRLERLTEAIQGDIDVGDVKQATSRVTEYNQVELGAGHSIDVLQDHEAIKEAFEDKQDPLVVYPGALGEFFQGFLERDAFVSFLGPEKRGKSFWLLDMAFRALYQRRRVAYFDAGDNSQNQVIRRMMSRLSARPMFKKEIRYPRSIDKDAESKYASVITKLKKYDRNLSWRKAMQSCDVAMRKRIRSQDPLLKLSCHPNSTLSIAMIIDMIKAWEREDWIPDVIVIDYADILDMSYWGLEGRERINETWKRLRSLSQRYHCLVVTATQANAAAYDRETMGAGSFSEDKRKAAHVTGMVGLNQSTKEKRKGIMRLNWIHLREGDFLTNKCVHVAGCLSIGNPAIKSTF